MLLPTCPCVLIRNEDGLYVADMNVSTKGYTSNLNTAKIFEDRKQAEANACGNERTETLASQLRLRDR